MLLVSLPIFLIIFFGWLFKKFKIINDQWIHILNSFAYYVSLPALIIASFWEISFLDKNSLNIIFWSVFSIVLFSFFVFLVLSFIKINKSAKTAIFLSATVGNTIYMGFPLVELGLGKEYLLNGVLIGVIYLVAPLLISIFVIRYWHSREHSIFKQLFDFLKNPLVISSIAGIAVSFINFDSEWIFGIKKSISMLGLTASPISLFALGGFLYKRFLKKDLGKVIFVSSLKMVAFPLIIAIYPLYFFKINDSNTFILLASMPVAVTTFVIAEKFNMDKDLVGNSIFISTIFSFIVTSIIFVFIK